MGLLRIYRLSYVLRASLYTPEGVASTALASLGTLNASNLGVGIKPAVLVRGLNHNTSFVVFAAAELFLLWRSVVKLNIDTDNERDNEADEIPPARIPLVRKFEGMRVVVGEPRDTR